MEKQEGNIIWEVQNWRQPVLINIKDLDGEILDSREYTCMHEPIFGIFGEDVDDAREIDLILDDLIAKWKKD